MAKDINLTWDVTAMAGATDIDGVDLFKSTVAPAINADAAEKETWRAQASSIVADLSQTVSAHTYTESVNGAYYYGAFSKNTGGYGPGDVTQVSTTVN